MMSAPARRSPIRRAITASGRGTGKRGGKARGTGRKKALARGGTAGSEGGTRRVEGGAPAATGRGRGPAPSPTPEPWGSEDVVTKAQEATAMYTLDEEVAGYEL